MKTNKKFDSKPEDMSQVNVSESKANRNYVIKKRGGSRFAPKYSKAEQDPFWYAQDSSRAKDMGSFPWNEVLGTEYYPHSSGSSDQTPGFMIIENYPTLGSFSSTVDTSTANSIVSMFYNYVAQGFTSGLDFEAPDLFMATIAGADVATALIEGKRAYGMLHYFLQQNKSYAKLAVESLGFDYASLSANMADFRTSFNQRVDQFNKVVPVPKGLSIAERWHYLHSYIFTDTADAEFSTAYAYRRGAYMKFNATESTTGSALQWIFHQRSDLWTVSEYFSFIDDLLEAVERDDVRSIYSAVRRVYSDEQLIKASYVDESFVTPVVRNDVVAAAVHNMRSLGYVSGTNADFVPIGWLPGSNSTTGSARVDFPVTQANARIFSRVAVRPQSPLAKAFMNTLLFSEANHEMLLDIYDHLNTPENVLDITANMQAILPRIMTSIGGESVYVLACRTEIITCVYLSTFVAGADSTDTIPTRFGYEQNVMSDWIQHVALMSHVDSHPYVFVYKMHTLDGSERADVAWNIGEVDKYTLIDITAIDKLHRNCMWKLLEMPQSRRSTAK